jgi:hypothetical protein
LESDDSATKNKCVTCHNDPFDIMHAERSMLTNVKIASGRRVAKVKGEADDCAMAATSASGLVLLSARDGLLLA